MQCCLLSSFRFSRTAQCRICYSIRYRRQICNNIHKICIFALYKAGLTGDFVQVRVTGSYEYDLIGELEDEFTK